MQIVPAVHSFRGFRKLIQRADIEKDLTEHQKDILRSRLEILTYLKRHQGNVSEVARLLGCSRKHVTETRNRYRKGGHTLLLPKRYGPKEKRGSQLPYEIRTEIIALAARYPVYGYRKIGVKLRWKGYRVSQSAVYDFMREKEILRHQRCPRKPDRHRLKRGKRKIKRLRRPEDHQALKPGDLVALDSITEYVPVDRGEEQKYFITAIDLATEIGLALSVPSLTSAWAVVVLRAMERILRCSLQAVLTDNGSEFLRNFHRDCMERKITHYFTHPRTPEQNAVAERFNQTVQDECLYLTDLSRPREELNEILCAWLLEYNLGRPHQTLGYIPPAVQYFRLLTRSVQRKEVLPRLWSSTAT
jgi:transposase InsO family protein